MGDMRMAIDVLNRIRDNYSRQWKNASKPNHKGKPLTSKRWLYTNPYHAIRPYLNGREVGFAIDVVGGKIRGQALSDDQKDHKVVVFSEHRSSDSLVVYTGTGDDFDTDQFNPRYVINSDRKYMENATFFNPSEMDKAVDFIEKQLFDIQIEEDEIVREIDLEETN